MVKMIFLGLMLTLTSAVAGEEKYMGPNCLGPYCIDKEMSPGKVFKELGIPLPKLSEAYRFKPYCIQTTRRKRYIQLQFHLDGNMAEVSSLLLSDFPNCLGHPLKTAPLASLEWKTRQGIGLGSAEAAVLRAYGKPSREDNVNATVHKVVIQGWDPKQGTSPRIGQKVLVYTGAWDDLSLAEFGIRDGKVSWICLAYSE